ncbi:YceI family protein [Pseudogemmatithrix spongiicola]|uniref:YceI family protein n=1 Tax=Pseudogemmatithrix spongiicola TaxID=3062599 RepID=A0AA49Q5W0_9BACT|nr:YceI family protein [Gemmatimonadaceae bacterium 'strain 138']WKW15970.1 YceI family protein [Gemmatimonadaceae bacterium 'strain 318']
MRVPTPRWPLAIAALVLVAAATPMLDSLRLKPESRLWFDGTSTVRDWSCKATQMQATIDGEAAAPAAVLDGRKAVRTVEMVFPVASLDCQDGNRTMNNHMRNALNATQHQTIRFQLTDYTLARAANTTGALQGQLTINGQTRAITVPVQFANAAGALRVTGRYPLAMTQWGVQPPRLMMGTLKVGDTITVNFDLLLQP